MKKAFLLFVILLSLLISCVTFAENTVSPPSQSGWSCIGTFNDFLYQMVKIDQNDLERLNRSTIYPSSPWELSGEIPESVFDEISKGAVTRTNIELARIYSGQIELWIRSGKNIIKHNAGTNDFSIIPAFPYDESGKIREDVYVQDIFETVTGKVFGINFPKNYGTAQQAVWLEKTPLFSVYSEAENKFEIYNFGLNYLSHQVGFDYVGMIPRDGIIISKSDNLIWIYQQQDGLYSYNPLNSELLHYQTTFDGIVQRIAVSQEGFLLFSQKMEDSWKLSPGELVKYYPASQTTEELKVPFFRWPDYGTMLFTNSGDLWIGIHGYMSKNGSWVLQNPDRLAYIDLGAGSDTYNWQQPDLLFQSSNGYLWYINETWDGLGVDGSAWYDPITKMGCWFTTESGNIVEDHQNNLWMTIGDKIYKYALSQ